jgi:hypothetical protein
MMEDKREGKKVGRGEEGGRRDGEVVGLMEEARGKRKMCSDDW